MTIDISDYPVMSTKCVTCPFRTNDKGRHPDGSLVAQIQKKCFSEGSQICHHPRLSNQNQTHLCRGARDFQLEIFYRIGVIDEPTDAAWGISEKGF